MSCDSSTSASPKSTVKVWLVRIVFWCVVLTPVVLWPKAVGIALVALVILVAVVWYGIKWKLRKIFGGIGESFEEYMASLGVTAYLQSDMELVEREEVKWVNAREAIGFRAALETLGFDVMTVFGVKDVESFHVAMAVHREENLWAFLYDHTSGCILEMAGQRQDGAFFAATNAKVDSPSPSLTAAPVQIHEEADAATLKESVTSLCPAGERKPVSESDIEAAFRDYIKARRIWFLGDEEAEEQLHESLKESFLLTSGWTALEWDKKGDRVFFVHDRSSVDTCLYPCLETLNFDEDDDDAYEKEEARIRELLDVPERRTIFREFMEKTDVRKRCDYVMSLTEPVEADVYLQPEY